jgi:uncharacterized repeat protein (TIGR03803 family)
MKRVLRFSDAAFALLLLCLATAITAPAQTFTSLVSFDGTNGANPLGSLVQGFDGSFYGTTSAGGAYGKGTVFKITAGGTLTTLYSFCPQGGNCTDGLNPNAGLALGIDGSFYGTAYAGGTNFDGTVFKITPQGTLTTLHRFDGSDGAEPGALIQGADGSFYGTTFVGGANNGGSIFKITPQGTLTTLHSFCAAANCADGTEPNGAIVQATDGNFYGTTYAGGAYLYYGSVFKITPGGALTTFYSFCAKALCPDGSDPVEGLVQAADGNFYGTTAYGGANNSCSDGCGTVFKITSGGILTTLYSFCTANCADGFYPYAGPVQATDSDLYGTTTQGGANNVGSIFKITPQGTLTTLYSFCSQTNCADGAGAFSNLFQATTGNFYGATYGGAAPPVRAAAAQSSVFQSGYVRSWKRCPPQAKRVQRSSSSATA